MTVEAGLKCPEEQKSIKNIRNTLLKPIDAYECAMSPESFLTTQEVGTDNC